MDTADDQKPPKADKKSKPPLQGQRRQAAQTNKKLTDVEKKLDEPTPDISLTKDEAKILKQVVFRNYFAELDPIYRKVADKEANVAMRAVRTNLNQGLIDIGEPKTLEDVVKANAKDYKGLIYRVESSDWNPRFKKALAGPNAVLTYVPHANLNSQ